MTLYCPLLTRDMNFHLFVANFCTIHVSPTCGIGDGRLLPHGIVSSLLYEVRQVAPLGDMAVTLTTSCCIWEK